MVSSLHDIPDLDRKGLREFAFVTGGIVGVLFGLGFPWLLDRPWPLWPWVITAVLVVWGIAAPATLNPVYRGWMRFGLLLNRIMTPVILGIVYFVVITPMAVIMRIRGRDPLSRAIDRGAATYRIESQKPPIEKMEKPF